MDWTQTFDGYCERTDPSYWSEPVNAITNAAFMLVAIFMWRRSSGQLPAQYLSGVLFLIGAGSYLFHTHATAWASLVDVLPIAVFALSYIYLANMDFMEWGRVRSAAGMLGYLPFSAGVLYVLDAIPFFNISAVYWPLVLMIAGYGLWFRSRRPGLGNGLLIGAAILTVSLTFRSLDEIVCGAFPLGTHFLWHILNAIMLGWMVEGWLRYGTKPR